jgi:hypothetical protein
MGFNVVVKRKIRIDGKDYESLDDVPADKCEAVAKALDSIPSSASGHLAGKLSIDGHTCTTEAEIPPAVLGLVEGALSAVIGAPGTAERESQAIRPEPLLSGRTLTFLIVACVALASLAWLAF